MIQLHATVTVVRSWSPGLELVQDPTPLQSLRQLTIFVLVASSKMDQDLD